MKVNRTVLGWGAIIALIIVSGILSALWPTISGGLTGGTGPSGGGGGGPSVDTAIGSVALPNNLPLIGGVVLNEVALLALLTALVFGGIAVSGLILWFLYVRLDRVVVSTKSAQSYTSGVSALQNRTQAQIKELTKRQPPDGVPDHDESRWLVISSALTIGLLMMFLGAAFADEFAGGSNQFNIALGFGIVGSLIGFALLNVNRVRAAAANENKPLPGSALWIVVTGLLVLGLIGVMMWVRAQGAA